MALALRLTTKANLGSTLRDDTSYCHRMVPALADVSASEWMGVRPSFPDSLPVIEKVPDQNGLFAVFGHSHNGLMMAPKTGQLLAQLVSAAPINIDMSVYSSQ